MKPQYTEEELSILYCKAVQDCNALVGMFGAYHNQENLEQRIIGYLDLVKESDRNQGSYRRVNNQMELFDLESLYDIFFGELENVPLQINYNFKEAAKYRLSIGK
jgi:hypothetical protein